MLTREAVRRVLRFAEPSLARTERLVRYPRVVSEVIADDEVHVFVARPEEVGLATALRTLPEDERAWVATFHFERHRREHAMSRALVRRALARYVDRAPEAFRWSLGSHGKPFIDPPCGIHFNATNHVDFAACAVARHADLGIDVEPLDRGDEILEVAHTVFSPAELAELASLDIAKRRDRAVTFWTVKEAYIKAVGLGLSAPVREITIAELGDWFLETHDRDGFRIATALRGPRAAPRVTFKTVEW